DALQQALAMQIQASNALIALLSGGMLGAQPPNLQPQAALPAVQTPAASTATTTAPSSAPAASSSNNEDGDEQAFEAKGFGPYRPLDMGRGGLDDRARDELNKFIEAYSERTVKSKQLANEQRAHLSDARSISGFRQDWKEMVYQIAGAGSKGTSIWDIDGNEYIDFTSGFGSNIIGYTPEPVVEAIKQQAEAGFELGTLSPKASEAAKIICDITGMDRVTFTNTGSESLTAACRSARTITGKDRIAVFLNEYHGIADELLVNLQKLKNGKSRTVPTSPGIPQFLVENVLVLEWDDPHYMDKLREQADEIAGIIIEPVQSRNPGFHTHQYFKEMREFTLDNNIALIFDEMITGFRLAPGGAQEYFDIEVDMACYGKIVSSGTSLSVLAGRGEYLDCFDGGPWQFGDSSFPEAGVTFFGGTYTRHPLALAATLAGLKMLQELTTEDYQRLNERSAQLNNELNEVLIAAGFPARFESQSSILELEFNDDNPFSRLFFYYMRHQGIMIYDRPIFIQLTHTEAELQKLVEAVATTVDQLQSSGIVPAVTIDNYYGGSQEVAFTEAQQEIWLTSLLGDEASRAYNEQVIYEMDTTLNIYA
ncbi:MAG: aminotransferase class III-fold pyridoxal phosphate-dependent enzyme, partial [Pseudomonadales bacterium]|nr:aminotransferase class III-fold pyridoxal phosphate-dependent enzyme [Pseudomonadales bacterium]